MATVNFSVPESIKKAFNAAFAGENKSAIIAKLMQEAVEEKSRKKKRARAIDRLLKLRAATPPVSSEEIHAAREELRK